MIKRSTFTRVIYNSRPLQYFTSVVDPMLKLHRDKCSVFYGNNRTLANDAAGRYGDRLERSEHHCLDNVKITSAVKKDEKWHAM